MKKKLDMVGYFGTTFSYATVARHVACALMQRGRLGSLANFDDDWHLVHADLKAHAEAHSAEQSSHVFVVCAPEDHFASFARIYGSGQSALFVSPNHDDMSDRHATVVSKFGLHVAPSHWCADSAFRAASRAGPSYWGPGGCGRSIVCPLGVDEELLEARSDRIQNLKRRAMMGDDAETVLLHLSTDQSWAGRKGTKELLGAFAQAFPNGRGPVRLRLHVQPAVRPAALREVRELALSDAVEVLSPEESRGLGTLSHLLRNVDMVVAPSRSEGFGIMLLSSLVAGVPLLCTTGTGQYDFLSQLPGWMGIPTGPHVQGVAEAGEHPLLDRHMLAESLRHATLSAVRMHLLEGLGEQVDWSSFLWSKAASDFADRLIEWVEGDIEK